MVMLFVHLSSSHYHCYFCVVQLIVTHLKEQNAGLSNQLTELQSQLEWARKTERTLIDSQVLCVCVCECVCRTAVPARMGQLDRVHSH